MLALLLSSSACVHTGHGEASGPVVLESEAVCLVLESSPRPRVAEMTHRKSGINLVSESGPHALFLISLRRPDGSTFSVNDLMAETTSIVGNTNADSGPEAILTYADFPDCQLRVTVRVQMDVSPELTEWSIRIENPEKLALESVRFPRLYTVSQIGPESTDDVIVLPYLPGSILEDPYATLEMNKGERLTYPGSMSAQFLALQDRAAGFFFGSRDASGHPRQLGVTKREGAFEFDHTYELNGAETAEWTAPYPTVAGVTEGTWHHSADLYKRWAEKQAWCAVPLAERDDVPGWFKQGPLVYICEVRKYDKDRKEAGSFYPGLQENLECLREKVEGPILCMSAGWEKHRRWTAGEYFPIFDQDRAKETFRRISADGFRPFFFLSGLFYTFENVGVDGGTIPSAEDHTEYYVIDQETGKPRVFTLNEGSKTHEWSRDSYSICVETPFAKPFFRTIIDKAHEVGVDVLQMDQTTSGAGSACYSTEHTHEPGTGQYQTLVFHDLLDDMRQYGKSKSADFALFHEELHEELITHLDGFHTRECNETSWYRGRPNQRGIPLFTYLYHEYAIAYGDGTRIGPHDEAWNTRCQAVNLVTGKSPGIAVWSGPGLVATSHPAPLAMARNHCRLLKTEAGRFLMLGAMLHPYELSVPEITYCLQTRQGPKNFSEPSVLTSSWRVPDGSVGHLFVNLAENPQTISLDLDGRGTQPPGKYMVRTYHSAADNGFTDLWRNADLPRPFSATLPSRELVFVEIQAEKSAVPKNNEEVF